MDKEKTPRRGKTPKRRSSTSFKRYDPSEHRSGLEEKIDEQLKSAGTSYTYENPDTRIPYTVPSSDHKYLPDFCITRPDGTTLIIEAKGIWSYEDRYKHLLIRQQHPELDIRFIFSRSKSRISKRSTTTFGDICEGLGRGPFKGITWKYSDKIIPTEWLNEVQQPEHN